MDSHKDRFYNHEVWRSLNETTTRFKYVKHDYGLDRGLDANGHP